MLASTDNTSDCSILTVGDRIKIGGRTWPVKAKITTPGQRLASYALSMVIRLSQAPNEYQGLQALICAFSRHQEHHEHTFKCHHWQEHKTWTKMSLEQNRSILYFPINLKCINLDSYIRKCTKRRKTGSKRLKRMQAS